MKKLVACGMLGSKALDLFFNRFQSKCSHLAEARWDGSTRVNEQSPCRLLNYRVSRFPLDESNYYSIAPKNYQKEGGFLLAVIAFLFWLMPISSYAESSAYKDGKRIGAIQASFYTVAFCMRKYEAWSDEQAATYLQGAYMSLSQKDRDFIRLMNARVPELRHPSAWQRAVNNTLQAYGGCHNFLEQTGQTDLLMLLNQEEKYSDRPF
jgi:hypothetical protein